MKKLITLIILSMIIFVPQSAFAASLNLNTECSSDMAVGESFTVTVKYSSDYLDSIKGNIQYDTDLIEYISGGTSTGDGGIVSIKGNSDDGRTMTFNLKFKALKQGTASIAISTEEAYDLDGKAMNTPYVTRNITIEAASAGEVTDNTGDGGKNRIDSANQNINKDSDKDNTSAEPDQRSLNSRLIVITAAVTAAVLAAVCIIAGVRKKKRNRNKEI